MSYIIIMFLLKKNKEYLTEKQLSKGGPLLIDIDLRYDESIQTRQHTSKSYY